MLFRKNGKRDVFPFPLSLRLLRGSSHDERGHTHTCPDIAFFTFLYPSLLLRSAAAVYPGIDSGSALCTYGRSGYEILIKSIPCHFSSSIAMYVRGGLTLSLCSLDNSCVEVTTIFRPSHEFPERRAKREREEEETVTVLSLSVSQRRRRRRRRIQALIQYIHQPL